MEDVKYVKVGNLGPRLYRYSDRLRSYMDLNPEYWTIWILQDNIFGSLLQLPPTFMQSCRLIYLEADYDFRYGLCSNKIFNFNESRALISWIRTLNAAEKRAVGEIHMTMYSYKFNHPGIAPAIHQLSGVRKLRIWFWTDEHDVSMYTSDVQAHIVCQFVRNVRVSEVLIVNLAEEHAPIDFNWTRYRWPAYGQDNFALAVEARIRRPLSRVRYRLPLPVSRPHEAKFVLRVKKPLE